VACTQFDKLKAGVLDIQQEHITSHHGKEVEQDHSTENCELQEKFIFCIRHHHYIMK